MDTRVIYCGDNLEQLKRLPDGCIDLVYIDPPFNSNRNYEVFWGETKRSGRSRPEDDRECVMDKEFILQEIRRTAAANAGVPLGWRRFLTETGIRQTDWLRRYWARWSEAVREAGFSANAMTDAYEDEELLAVYATLTMELGRLPTSADMRLRTRNDPTFPHEGPFRRFGSKAQMVRRLLEFCRTHDGFDAVDRMCQEYSSRGRERPHAPGPRDDRLGFVYLMKSGRYYKIGKSNAPGRREYELALQLPEEPTTIHLIRTDDPEGIERYWHERFKNKRKGGEWFDLDAEDITAFKRRKHFM